MVLYKTNALAAKKVVSKVAKGITSLEDMPLRNALVTDEGWLIKA